MNPLSSLPPTNTSGATSAAAANALTGNTATAADSESRFLKLLVTQLKNQDPLSPLENAELTSQLAQMSTVSGIEKLNAAFASMVSQSGASQVLASASLIGRNVLAAGAALVPGADGTSRFGIDLPDGAGSARVNITNSAGVTVRTLELGTLPPGVKTLAWDGLDERGARLPADDYRIGVEASVGDASVAAQTLTFANVVSVSQSARGVSLDLGGGRTASLADLRLIN
jgi:flagellar basal-body rod modification protein FlgD